MRPVVLVNPREAHPRLPRASVVAFSAYGNAPLPQYWHGHALKAAQRAVAEAGLVPAPVPMTMVWFKGHA
jgi:hypothetical protein